jgi:hypothetical protein
MDCSARVPRSPAVRSAKAPGRCDWADGPGCDGMFDHLLGPERDLAEQLPWDVALKDAVFGTLVELTKAKGSKRCASQAWHSAARPFRFDQQRCD